jgi:hypothetical protein
MWHSGPFGIEKLVCSRRVHRNRMLRGIQTRMKTGLAADKSNDYTTAAFSAAGRASRPKSGGAASKGRTRDTIGA